jgi:cytochrome c-type biogenesis protein CcmF
MGEGSQRTVVAKYINVRDDFYVIIGMANPQSTVTAFQMHVNTLISWIWAGGLILMLGTIIAMWPEVAFEEAGAWSYVRVAGSAAAAVIFGFLLASGPGMAYASELPARAGPGFGPSSPPISFPIDAPEAAAPATP